jgi:stearoyl-CoA desaturase (delta-9 desaturase)
MSHQPVAEDSVAIPNAELDRLANAVVTVVPLALLGVGVWLAWGGVLHWQDVVVLAITYILTGVGITVGFHGLFTHRSFKTRRSIRALFAVLGSAAVKGPAIEWVSTHRKHHRFSDRTGDPHSPHADHGLGWRGALRGLFTRTSDGCSAALIAQAPSVTRRTCSPTPP